MTGRGQRPSSLSSGPAPTGWRRARPTASSYAPRSLAATASRTGGRRGRRRGTGSRRAGTAGCRGSLTPRRSRQVRRVGTTPLLRCSTKRLRICRLRGDSRAGLVLRGQYGNPPVMRTYYAPLVSPEATAWEAATYQLNDSTTAAYDTGADSTHTDANGQSVSFDADDLRSNIRSGSLGQNNFVGSYVASSQQAKFEEIKAQN